MVSTLVALHPLDRGDMREPRVKSAKINFPVAA